LWDVIFVSKFDAGEAKVEGKEVCSSDWRVYHAGNRYLNIVWRVTYICPEKLAGLKMPNSRFQTVPCKRSAPTVRMNGQNQAIGSSMFRFYISPFYCFILYDRVLQGILYKRHIIFMTQIDVVMIKNVL
jgi:hypothetical protein